jgi:hypothetical protein
MGEEKTAVAKELREQRGLVGGAATPLLSLALARPRLRVWRRPARLRWMKING